MSNVFQNALANSALVAVLDSSKTGDVFHYKTTATPTIATERIVLDPLGGTSADSSGKIVRFELPRYGMLSKLIVAVDIAMASNGNQISADPMMLNAVEYYEIVSQNRVLSRMTRENIVAAIAEMDYSNQFNLLEAAGQNPAGDTSVATTYYLPWLGKISGLHSALNERWDTGFTERLEFRVKFRDAKVLNEWDDVAAGTFANCKLITFFDILKETDLKSLRQANYGAGPLVLLNTSTFTEGQREVTTAIGTAAADHTFTIPINCNGVTPKTTISIRRVKGGAPLRNEGQATQIPLADKADGLQIKKIVLSGSGRELLSWDGLEIQHLGRSSYMGGELLRHIITIDWSCGKQLPGYSGGVSWREIASPELQITYVKPAVIASTAQVTQTDATDRCVVTHMQYDLLSVLPSNGRVQQSIST